MSGPNNDSGANPARGRSDRIRAAKDEASAARGDLRTATSSVRRLMTESQRVSALPPSSGTLQRLDDNSSRVKILKRLRKELGREPKNEELLAAELEHEKHQVTDRDLEINRLNQESITADNKIKEISQKRTRRLYVLIASILFFLSVLILVWGNRKPQPVAPPPIVVAPHFKLSSVGYVASTHFVRILLTPDSEGMEMPTQVVFEWDQNDRCSVASITTYATQPNGELKLWAEVPMDHNPLLDWADFVIEPGSKRP